MSAHLISVKKEGRTLCGRRLHTVNATTTDSAKAGCVACKQAAAKGKK